MGGVVISALAIVLDLVEAHDILLYHHFRDLESPLVGDGDQILKLFRGLPPRVKMLQRPLYGIISQTR
jgi:hypothetical protein